MKKVIAVLAAVAALLSLAGCRRHAAPSVEGRVVDATIYSVTLETEEGESFTFSTRGTDPMLVPGVLPGDGVRIFYQLLPDNQTLQALQLDIVEPSAYRLIPGIWRDCTRDAEVGLVLAEDGSARSVGMGETTLQDWSLDGDQLVLTVVIQENPKQIVPYIFEIEQLSADSLVVHLLDTALRLVMSRSE